MTEPDSLAERFEEHRVHLRGVAYRMLGSAGGAEDAVQEAWLRLIRQADAASDDSARGAIVNLISTEAVTAAPDHVAFAATQGGLLQMTKAVALALSSYGVRVNAVGIGAIKSEIAEDADKKRLREAAPLKRLGDPEEVAATVRALGSIAN